MSDELMAEARKMWILAAATLERDLQLHGMTDDEQRVMICAVLNAAERTRTAITDDDVERLALDHDVSRGTMRAILASLGEDQ